MVFLGTKDFLVSVDKRIEGSYMVSYAAIYIYIYIKCTVLSVLEREMIWCVFIRLYIYLHVYAHMVEVSEQHANMSAKTKEQHANKALYKDGAKISSPKNPKQKIILLSLKATYIGRFHPPWKIKYLKELTISWPKAPCFY